MAKEMNKHRYQIDLLQLLDVKLPPPSRCHHSIHFAQYGSDHDGWSDRLALTLPLQRPTGERTFLTLFFDPEDFQKESARLAESVLVAVHSAGHG